MYTKLGATEKSAEMMEFAITQDRCRIQSMEYGRMALYITL